jgi:hypothetical protein
LRPTQAKSETLSQKYPTQKRASGVAQVVEHLPSKLEALTSNSSTLKKEIYIYPCLSLGSSSVSWENYKNKEVKIEVARTWSSKIVSWAR